MDAHSHKIALAICVGETSCVALFGPLYIVFVAVRESCIVPPLTSPPNFAGFSFLVIYLVIGSVVLGLSFALLVTNGFATWFVLFIAILYFMFRFQSEVHAPSTFDETVWVAQAISASGVFCVAVLTFALLRRIKDR